MKVLIIHTYGLGDMIMFTPALKQLMRQYKNISIDILVFQKMASEAIIECKSINNVYYADFSIRGILKIIPVLRHNTYDLSIITSGTNPIKAGIFSSFVGAKERVGEYLNYPLPFYTKNIKYQEHIHRVENNILLVSDSLENISEPFFCIDKFWKTSSKQKIKQCITVGVHAGSNAKFKMRRWPKEYFVILLNLLKEKYECEICVFGGPDEMEESQYIAKETQIKLISGKSLKDAASLIADCDLFINTDSGLGHIASCFDMETFTIFGPAKAYKTSPYSNKAHIIKLNLECQPCYGTDRVKNCKDFKCLHELSPTYVFSEIVKKSKVLSNV